MEHQLKLTARGHAICELMVDQGLTLEAACARVDHELETLRQTVDSILTESSWEDIARAMQAALEGVSLGLQRAYLEESAPFAGESVPASAPWHDGARVH
jgi:hypothetical protein